MAARTARLARSAYVAVNAGKSNCSALRHTHPFLSRVAELSGATIASNGISSVAYSPTGVKDGVFDNVAKSVKSLNGVEKGPLRLFHSSAASSSQVMADEVRRTTDELEEAMQKVLLQANENLESFVKLFSQPYQMQHNIG